MNVRALDRYRMAPRMLLSEITGRVKRWLSNQVSFLDVLLLPLIYPAAWLLKNVRRVGVHRMPNCRDVLIQIGVFPIRNHYYEPRFDYRKAVVSGPVSNRRLPGIDLNVHEQLRILGTFSFSNELKDTPRRSTGELEFHICNGAFESGDAEYWYQLIRAVKPARIYEIGSGNSSLMAMKAIRKNRLEDEAYQCDHICIEPYEMEWLEKAGTKVMRKRVEDIEVGMFRKLQSNDILFIDSSHVIRPGGDVVFEYLELLPVLNKGVIVHVHDIFTPRDYPRRWLEEEIRLWNEQYLLEAFLTHNSSWKIMGALNYLHHNHYERLKAVAPFLTRDREPGSFYLKRVS